MPALGYRNTWFDATEIVSLLKTENDRIQEIADDFKASVLRSRFTLSFPSRMLSMAARYQQALDIARLKHYGTITPTDDQLNDKPKERLVRDEQEQIVQSEELEECLDNKKMHKFLGRGANAFIELCSRYDAKDFIRPVYHSLISQSWTAIEVALKKLWIASNEILVGKHAEDIKHDRRILDVVQTMRGESLMKKKEIDKISKQGGQRKFGTLVHIRVAYSLWFYGDSTEIDTQAASLDLDSLALIRNLIAHSELVPDPKFRGQAVGIPGLQKWTDLNLDLIDLRGEDVKNLLQPAYTATSKLIQAVDSWHKLKS